MAHKSFRAQDLRALLSVVLVLTAVGGGALFYFSLQTVKEYAVEVNNRLADADASDLQIKQFQALRAQLSQSESLIAKADLAFATSDSYQAQALTDIRNYANQIGVSIESTDFADPSTGSYAIVVKLKNPTNYQNLIKFITLIEGNIPKMQVSSITLKHVPGSDASVVEVENIKINIYVR